jgi:hypothetical protein
MQDASKTSAIRLRSANPRKNLPNLVSRKRGESNFLRAFERAYFAARVRGMLIWQDFALEGFGIADLIWIGWVHGLDTTALTIEELRRSLQRRLLVAFELKLNNWRVALMQAHRYRYFADRAIVVLPTVEAIRAESSLPLFKRLEVGLWGFNPETMQIRRIYTPSASKPKSANARRKAIDRILTRAQFSKSLK